MIPAHLWIIQRDGGCASLRGRILLARGRPDGDGEVSRVSKPADFEFLPHTADVAVVARGESLRELFEHAGLALFSLLTDVEGVRDRTSTQVEIQSPDRESLLVDWLNELLYLFDCEGKLFCRFTVSELGESSLKAEVRGERIDPGRHRIKMGVKAVTYHDLEIKRSDDGWMARMVFDV